jgi:hypothetical protein
MVNRRRLSKNEKLVSAALKELNAKEKQSKREFPSYARLHATAVAAIVLAGQPEIDEPLNRAWGRALQHYQITMNQWGRLEDQFAAARRLHPIIIGSEESSRFAEIFETAPSWLLQFTGIAIDARFLEFDLPDISTKFRWGSAGFEETQQWPSLPSGTLTAGDPIPDRDPRQLYLAYLDVLATRIPIDREMLLLSRSELEILADDGYRDPLLDDIKFALDLEAKPVEEWSRYERRRMRKLSEWIEKLPVDTATPTS